MTKPHAHLADRHQMYYLSDALRNFVESIQPPGPIDIDSTSEYMRVWPDYVVGLQLVELSFKALIAKGGVALNDMTQNHDLRLLYRSLTSEERNTYEAALNEFAKHVHPTLPPISFNDKGNWNILQAHRYFPLEGGKRWKVNKKTKAYTVSPVQDIFRISVWHIREMCFVSHRLLGVFSDDPSMGTFLRRLEWRFRHYFNNVYRLSDIDVGVHILPDDTDADVDEKCAKLISDKLASLGSTLEERLWSVIRDEAADNILRTDAALYLGKLWKRSDVMQAQEERVQKEEEDFQEQVADPNWKGSLLRQALDLEPRQF